MTWVWLAHISGHGVDSRYVVVLTIVAGVFVCLGLGSLNRRERAAIKRRR